MCRALRRKATATVGDKKMAKKRLDFRTRSSDNYYEHTATRGNEVKEIHDVECLWQEFVGELKTNKGECVGVGMENYGSDLKRYLGENMNPLLEIEIEDCIQSTAQEYVEIITSSVEQIDDDDEGYIAITIKLETIYGLVLRVLNIARGC